MNLGRWIMGSAGLGCGGGNEDSDAMDRDVV